MTKHLYQLFRQAEIIRAVPVRPAISPESNGTSSSFVSLEDIQDDFKDAQQFELDGLPISFLPDLDGARNRSPCIAFYPDKILDVITEESQSSNNSAVVHCSTLAKVGVQTSRDLLLSSLGQSFISTFARDVEQTRIVDSKNKDLQQILGLLLEAKENDDKMLALQLEVKQKGDMILALQLEAKQKGDMMLTLQLEAKEKDNKMLQMQEQALGRLALIHRRAAALLTVIYELHEYPIPRLFIVLPKKTSKLNPTNIINHQFRLYFLCECGEHTKILNGENTMISHHIHPAKHDGYDIRRSKEFFQKYGGYMLTLLEMIKYGATIAGFVVPALAAVSVPGAIDMFKDSLNTISQSDVDQSIEYLQGLTDNNSKGQDSAKDLDADLFSGPDALEGADLRQLEVFIKGKDQHRVLGDLYRIVTQEGLVKWVCLDHFRLTYKEKEQQVFTDAVQLNGGFYEPQLGQVVVRLGSIIRAAEFSDALSKARRVDDLDITFDWECSRSDLGMLEDALKKSGVSILRLDLQNLRPSLGSKLWSTSARYGALFRIIERIMELPNMRMIHIVLPKVFLKLSSLPPKRPSHPHKLSFEMVPGSIGPKEFGLLAEMLKTNSTLTTLDLSDNSIVHKGAKTLFEALTTNSTQTTLNILGAWIKDNGTQVLSEALKTNSNGNNGAQALSKALETNSTLTTLKLRCNLIGDIGALALSKALKANKTLTTLDLWGNLIGDIGAQALSEALRINSTLVTLDLKRNAIGLSGAQALFEALKTKSTLITLDFLGDWIRDSGTQA
ncbi:hypothetical protein BGZ54_003057, partial [Gamsiella multidivaricata]